MGSFWHIFGVLLTIGSTILGAGIGWGSMRAGLTELKSTVADLKNVAQDVTVLKADSPRVWAVLDDHGKRIGRLEVDLASIPGKSKRRK